MRHGVRPPVRLAAVVLGVALLVAGCTSSPDPDPTAQPSADPGASFVGSGFAACPAPTNAPLARGGLAAVTVPCMDGSGGEVRLDRPTGRPTVVNLWGSWCPPCGEELPAFQRLHADAGGPGGRLVVLGVVTEDVAAGSVQAGRAVGVTFANVFDRQGAVRKALGVNRMPVTAFVGADGRVRHVHSTSTLTDDQLRQLVAEHLGVRVA